jgi:DNA-directed RNA polymerase sigma subunit (sigma70/sigma32)
MPSNEMPEASEAWFDAFLRKAVSEDRLKSLINRDLKAKIELMLNSLTHKEASILRKRFGLGGDKAQSVEALAVELDLSPDAVRNIERQALLKLKHPSRSGHLRSFGHE